MGSAGQPCAVFEQTSRSKRRRLRERRVAVRHALVNTRKLKDLIPVDTPAKQQVPLHESHSHYHSCQGPVDMKLSNLEHLLYQVLQVLAALCAPSPAVEQSGCANWSPIVEDIASAAKSKTGVFNTNAAEFVPGAHVRTEDWSSGAPLGSSEKIAAAIRIQLWYRQTKLHYKSRPQLPILSEVHGDFRSIAAEAWASIHKRFEANALSLAALKAEQFIIADVPVLEPRVSMRSLNDSIFAPGDEVFICSGPLEGYVGIIKDPGHTTEVIEAGSRIVLRGLCSVQLQNDPAKFESRLVKPAILKRFAVTRSSLQKNAEGVLAAMEANVIPSACHDALLPILRKASTYTRSGTPEQCALTDNLLNECLAQLAEDIIQHT